MEHDLDDFTSAFLKRSRERKRLKEEKENVTGVEPSTTRATFADLAAKVSDWEDESAGCLAPYTQASEKLQQESEAPVKPRLVQKHSNILPDEVEAPSKVRGLSALKAMAADFESEPVVSVKRNVGGSPSKLVRVANSSAQIASPRRVETPVSPKKMEVQSPKKAQQHAFLPQSPLRGDCEGPQKPARQVPMDTVVRSLEAQGYTKTESKSRIVYDFSQSPKKNVPLQPISEIREPSPSKARGLQVDSPSSKSVHKKAERFEQEIVNTCPAPSRIPPPPPQQTPTKIPTASKCAVKGVTMKPPSPMKSQAPSDDVCKIPQAAAERARKIQELEAARLAKIALKPTNSDSGVRLANPELRSVFEKASMFEAAITPKPKQKDPAELTVSERKILFESQMQTRDSPNRGSPARPSPQRKPSLSSQSSLPPLGRTVSNPPSIKKSIVPVLSREEPANSVGFKKFQKMVEKTRDSESKQPEPSPSTGSLVRDKISSIYGVREQPVEASPVLRPIEKAASPKKKMAPPPPPPMPESDDESEEPSEVAEEEDEDMDSEAGDTEPMDQSMALNSSFAFDILMKTGIQVEKKRRSDGTSEQSAKVQKTSEETQRKLSPVRSGNLGHYEESTEGEIDTFSDTSEEYVRNPVSLDYSLSVYRKQQYDMTPSKRIVRNPVPEVEKRGEATVSETKAIQEQIRALQAECDTQYRVMSQATQALTLCRSTQEFCGSTEQVEGEKLLLVAGLKRTAATNEIQRLKTDGAKNKPVENSRGTLSLSGITLGLKKEFVQLLDDGYDEYLHHFIVVLRCRGQVIATQMLSTVDGVCDKQLMFPNLIQFTKLAPDFSVSLEVFALQTGKERLGHEEKYHIKKESSRLWLTPKKLQKQDSKMFSSPANSTVRNSSFGLVGFVNISRSSLKRKEWFLEKVPFTSPLDGNLKVKIQCHGEVTVEERGFLTVFDEVQGFGAWHRRWCCLNGKQMTFWKYPDDERRKEPINMIDLRKCITMKVSPVPRELCARPNTFLLVTSRPVQPGDDNNLVMTIYKNRTHLSHKLSADSKEERATWCDKVNAALTEMRAWDLDALEPTENCDF